MILFKRRNIFNFSLNITQNHNVIKQHSVVKYFGSLLDEDMSVYRLSRYLSYPVKRMLCNTLIQLHYVFACCTQYPNLSISLKTKLQSAQSYCIRYCVGLKDWRHIVKNEFEKKIGYQFQIGLTSVQPDIRMLFLQNVWMICTHS